MMGTQQNNGTGQIERWVVSSFAPEGSGGPARIAVHESREEAMADVAGRIGEPGSEFAPDSEAIEAESAELNRAIGIESERVHRLPGGGDMAVATLTDGRMGWVELLDSSGYNESHEEGCGGVIVIGQRVEIMDDGEAESYRANWLGDQTSDIEGR